MLGFIKRLIKIPGEISLVKLDTLLTTKLYEPLIPVGNFSTEGEWLGFLKAHPASKFPSFWKENKGGRRVIKHRVVTDAFVAFVVDQLQAEDSTFGDFKYHDSGIGVGAEAAGDTALGTPWGGSRDTGTQIEGATGNIYKSVATTTYNATKAITEHGLFLASSAGTLMDRTVFSAINVVSGNAVEWTFQITFSSGG